MKFASARRRGANPRQTIRRVGVVATSATLAALTLVSGLTFPTIAHAATTVYEIEGEWSANTPNPVTSGTGLTSAFRYNINDNAAAPENTVLDNVTVTFVAQNARFTTLPTDCKTEDVDPVSAIVDDDARMICNVGPRQHGSAELLIPGLQSRGSAGDIVTMSASVGEPGVNEVAVSLPELEVSSPFAMDMKFDEGAPTSVADGDNQVLRFPWTLRHASGANAGPDSVSYDLTISGVPEGTTVPSAVGCGPMDLPSQTGHPNSGPLFGADRTAPFPASCSLSLVSPTVLRLTISGIDYSKSVLPRRDSRGVSLPPEGDVVASGAISFTQVYSAATFQFTANTPTYTSVAAETSVDKAENNDNSRVMTRGTWTGGWNLSWSIPHLPGSWWTDTYRAMASSHVVSQVGITSRETGREIVCQTIDLKYVTFEGANIYSGVNLFDGPGADIEYFTGTGSASELDPSSALYDPNAFRCGDDHTGWQSTPPADLSTVGAVRATMPPGSDPGIAGNTLYLYVDARVKENVAVGQDIWTWSAYRRPGFQWNYINRDDSTRYPPSVDTPDARYSFTGAGRDILRVVGGSPNISKGVNQPVTLPGATVGFNLQYQVDAVVNTTVDGLVLTDTLPVGLSYVPGSASVTPSSVNGRKITWNLDGVQTNTVHPILYSATVDQGAKPGQVLRNTVSIGLGGLTRSTSVDTRIRESGYTFLSKTADAPQVPHVDGVAQDGWTVRVSSADPVASEFTDTIDVLPYNGDGRGTSFSGTYALSSAVSAVDGSTVLYTEIDPATLSNDPADASNGAAGDPTGNTVGWSETFTPNATAVRVIGPSLEPNETQAFKIDITTAGAMPEDTYVNRADSRAARTKLIMRTSDWFQIAAVNSVVIKKYVQGADGTWHDAQNIDDYPSFLNGDTAVYRLVITNTGDETITGLQLSDDLVDLSALEPLPAGLDADATIAELLPGAENAITIEYEMELTGHTAGDTVINNACATPADESIDPSCDPAGLIILPSSLSWEKVNSADTAEFLSDSEWELALVDEDHAPLGPVIQVIDCVEDAAEDCEGFDRDPAAGKFLVEEVPQGIYRLIETKAPAGYVLDSDPRFIEVRGETAFELPITNTQHDGPELPFTGGTGTFAIFLGAGLAGGIALLLLARRRWSQQRLQH